MEIYFLSIVGQRPSAVAVTAKTVDSSLKRQKEHTDGGVRAFLFATSKTEYFANPLKQFLENELNWDVTLRIGNDLDSAIYREIKNIAERTPQSPILYNVSAGLKYKIVQIALKTQQFQSLIALFSEANHLVCLSSLPNAFKDLYNAELENIGMEWLVKLYGLDCAWSSTKLERDCQIYFDLEIKSDKESFKFPLACEHKGNLHVLKTFYVIPPQKVNQSSNKKSYQKAKYEARTFAARYYGPERLNGLRPRLYAITNNRTIKAHLNALGIETIIPEDADDSGSFKDGAIYESTIVEKWLKEVQKLSTEERSVQRDGPTKVKYGLPRLYQNERGFIVCLGTDPNPTLIALYSHSWDKAIILFDNYSDRITERAERIKAIRKKFKGEIYFYPFTVQGKLANKYYLEDLIKKGEWHCNITPGSKSQGWILAGMFPRDKLWLINRQKRAVVPVANSTENSVEIPCRYPPLEIVAAVNGGVSFDKRVSFEELHKKLDFLEAMAKWVAAAHRLKRYGALFKFKQGQTVRCENGHLTIVEVREDKSLFHIEIDGKEFENYLYGPPHQGNWLEEVVAGAFIKAGGEKVIDACVSFIWNWSNRTFLGNSAQRIKSEMDAILLWDCNYIGVSCKLGISQQYQEAAIDEIIDETREKLGRFAVPIIVSGHFEHEPEKAKEILSRSAMDGVALEVSLCLLDQFDLLRDKVDETIRSRQKNIND